MLDERKEKPGWVMYGYGARKWLTTVPDVVVTKANKPIFVAANLDSIW